MQSPIKIPKPNFLTGTSLDPNRNQSTQGVLKKDQPTPLNPGISILEGLEKTQADLGSQIKEPVKKPLPSFNIQPQQQDKPEIEFNDIDVKIFQDLVGEGQTPEEARQFIVDGKRKELGIEIEQEKGFLGRIGDKISDRGDNISNNFTDSTEDKGDGLGGAIKESANTFVQSVQNVGQLAGGVSDIIGESFVTGLKAITPDAVEDRLKDEAKKVLGTKGGQLAMGAIQDGVESYMDFRESHPETAESLEAVVNIAAILPVGNALKPISSKVGNIAGKGGNALNESAENTIKGKTDNFIVDLISPESNKKNNIADLKAGKTTQEGFLKSKTRTPDKFELEVANEVSKVPGVGPSSTLTENANAVQQQIRRLDDELIAQIKANDSLIPKREIKARINSVKNELADNPLLVGDAEKTAQKVIDKFSKLIDEHKGSSHGLLTARRELDNWITKQKGENFFDGKDNALSIAVKAIRKEANNLADEKAIAVPLKETLKRQSNLFRAIDNIAPKAIKEADNAIKRLFQRTQKLTGLKSETAQSVALLGGGGILTGAATIAPLAIGAGVTGYAAYRGIISPSTRKFLGGVLKEIDRLDKLNKISPEIQTLKSEITELIGEEQEND